MMTKSSLLKRDESTYIKGLLIILIILGHNSILMHLNDDGRWLKDWIYSFHVNSFFYLPFLYDIKPFKKVNVPKYFKRLIVPYLFFFVVLLTLNTAITGEFSFVESVIGFISGNNTALRYCTGFTYIWFLPSMFSFLILRDLYYTYNKIKISIILTSIVLLNLMVFYIIKPEFGMYFPFGLFAALVNIPIAIYGRYVVKFLHGQKYRGMIILGLAVVLTFIWFLFHPQKVLYNFFVYLLLPMTIFPSIVVITKQLNITNRIYMLFSYFGKISMGLYLISQIVYNILLHFFHIFDLSGWLLGLLLFILTVILSCILLSLIKLLIPSFYNNILK